MDEDKSMEDTKLKEIIKKGLLESPKYIPTWYLYDETGSSFHTKAVAASQNYYFSKVDMEIFSLYMEEILDFTTTDLTLIDYGCGDGIKSNEFIKGLLKRQKNLVFYPVDISKDVLITACSSLEEEHGDVLQMIPVTSRIGTDNDIFKLDIQKSKLILSLGFLGGISYEEQIYFLSTLYGQMTERDVLIISVDITTDEDTVTRAYTPSTEFAKMFFLNALTRLNKDMAGNIDTTLFELKREFVKDTSPDGVSYIKVWYECKEAHSWILDTLNVTIDIRKMEKIYLQNDGDSGFSYKYNVEQIQTIAGKAGFNVKKIWKDAKQRSAVCCLMKPCQ